MQQLIKQQKGKEVSILDWNELYSVQEKLDNYIEENHDLEGKDLFQEKCLALLVELGELANETRCFKFWSTKPRNEQSVILEEYVDGIHFLLSLGLVKGYRFESAKIHKLNHSETQQFLSVFHESTHFHQQPTEENYQNLFRNYLELGMLLGFTEEDIKNAYYHKNEINFQRQNKGY